MKSFWILGGSLDARAFPRSTGQGDPGLSSEEMAASVATLQSMASTLECDCVLLRERKSGDGLAAEYLVRRRAKENDFVEVR